MPGRPTASMLSFTSTGTPCSGPRSRPDALSRSRSSATDAASSAVASTARSPVALDGASTDSMRDLSASVRATLVSLPSAMPDVTSSREA